ncbi:23S rRNA (adenine(2030)-N(6))-methyltransferase RlmJ [Halomonas sp. Bachu 37]|uniref:23S rRNA (adenine(2030)-N(6))-methyltransferase RlmJ n=1 Tax=Halomonas kashgarensis TaxID=3084920 RepID=UPI003216F300
MLSYQHAYHAGNFADVHKHLTLFAVTDNLLRKKSPVTYIDTHAGRGLYPLSAEESSRLQEHLSGIVPLWQARSRINDPLALEWLQTIAAAQEQEKGQKEAQGKEPNGASLSHYPGSPWWLAQRLRSQDRLRLFELHPGEHARLAKQVLPANTRHEYGDGLGGLLAMLPVATPRLCVLIDPSYELKAEYREVAEVVVQAMRKARHAIVLIWYPLLPAGQHHELLESLRSSGLRKIWRSELHQRDPKQAERGMYGSGMLVVNPPWGVDTRLADAMRELTPLLGEQCRYSADWWVEE